MRGVELYRQIPGLLEPWMVSDAKLDPAGQQVKMQVNHPPECAWLCSPCGKAPVLHDYAPARSWRLYSQQNLPDACCEPLRGAMRQKLATKEDLCQLGGCHREACTRRYFKQQLHCSTQIRLKPMRKVAQMLKRRLDNILTYGCLRITHVVNEDINSKPVLIKRRACSHGNPKHNKITAYFFYGGLDLYSR